MFIKFLYVSSLILSLTLPANALEIGVDVDLGPVDADVSASVGHDSVAAVGAEIGIGNTAGVGPGAGPMQPAAGTLTAAEQKLRAVFIGKPVRSSDGAMLGEIAEVRPTTKRCPLFRIDAASSLKLGDKRIWLSTPRCDEESTEMRLSMTRKSFLNKVN